ncbi:MAG: hypothetical protein ABGX00_16290 [Allomuricauda sp.]
MIVMSEPGMKYAIEQFNKRGYLNGFIVERPEHSNPKDTERLKVAINALGVIHEIHKANIFLEEMGSETRIDLKIFHLILDKILNQYTKLTDEHRKRFFMETKKLEELRRTISSFSHTDFYFPAEVEYMVLGTSMEEVGTMNNCLSDEDFNDIYAHHIAYFQKGLMSYDRFIGSLREWIEMIREAKETLKVA